MKNNKIIIFLRRIFFWTMDFIKGSNIRKHYNEIKLINKKSFDSGTVIKYQIRKLNQLLHESISGVPYYKGNENDIGTFNIISKKMIQENYKSFINVQYRIGDVHKMSTSGSTGTPLTILQDRNKRNSVKAEIIYYSEKANYRVGKSITFLRALNKMTNKSKLKLFILNENLINISDLSEESILFLLNELKKKKYNNGYLLSYASSLKAISNYVIKNNINDYNNRNIKGIVSGAEYLDNNTRKIIERTFGCRVLSRYSNQENGVIGQDYLENNEFIINEANYIVEIYDILSDDKLPNNEVGRIVITDLNNFAMPLIKYDTGDIGAIKEVSINGIKKRVIYDFQGRKVDYIYSTSNKMVSPHYISNKLWEYKNIEQYQFIQEEKNQYTIKIVRKNKNLSENIENKIIQDFSSVLGEDMIIKVEYLDTIEIEPNGKFRYIKNNYTSNKERKS